MTEVSTEEGTIAGYNKKTLVTVFVALFLVGIAFYGGAKYEKNKLSRLGLLKGAADQAQAPSTKKSKMSPVVAVQKFAEQDYAKTAYLISGPVLSVDAKKALTGFVLSKKSLPNGVMEVMLKAQKTTYHDQVYTLKAGEQLYFIEKSLMDDVNEIESALGDDSAVVVDAAGNIVQGPADWSK